MNNKKLVALLITITLLLSSFTLIHADSPFIDIENNWAKDSIISVNQKGLMKGTSDNKFSPGNPVNKYSVLVTIAKMMDAEKIADLDDLVEKSKADLDKFKVPEYAKRETAFSLERGIILSDFDLESMSDKPNATKLDICVYLGRAFGVQQDATLPVQLFFRDTESIPRAYRGHVNHMIEIDVVDGKGDANGDFKPNDLVTRAMFAKMIDEASNAYKKQDGWNNDDIDDGLIDDDDYVDDLFDDFDEFDNDSTETVFTKGIIDSVIYKRNDKPKILLETEGKSIKEFYVPEDLIKENIILNGQLSDVYSLRPGMFVEVKAQNKIVRNIATVEFIRNINEKAIIRSIDFLNAEITVDIMDEAEQIVKEKKVYLQNANLVDISSVETILLDDLKRGQTVIIYGVEDETGIKAVTVIAQ
ncbi:MAG: S-layer homology domain-containing protein [Firmicutes bacterium]|nr:S-layer homology domain-containing protein [Bacillota bacterium]